MKKIALSNSKQALVDNEDFDYLCQFNWHVHEGTYTSYAIRIADKGNFISMHRELLQLKSYKENPIFIDHKDGDGLNNQKENLRLATRSQNSANSKVRKNKLIPYKGVSRKGNHFQSTITHNGNKKYLGIYKCPIEAAVAYDIAAKKYFGEFAQCNFPDVTNTSLKTLLNKTSGNSRKIYQNKSGFRGVKSYRGRFQALLTYNKKQHYLGTYNSSEEAALVYDKKAKEIYGENATLNFP